MCICYPGFYCAAHAPKAVRPMTDREARQLLDAVMYYLPMDIRHKIMREVPQAYNSYVGREVVKVVTP